MTATARRLSETSLAHERIDLQGPDDELKELADTFDAMLARLDRAFDAQRRFVDNASHELRTPLAINRTVLEVALADPDASDGPEGARPDPARHQRAQRAAHRGAAAARAQRTGAERCASRSTSREVAQTAVDQLARFAEENGVTVRTELYPARHQGDPVLLERCVAEPGGERDQVQRARGGRGVGAHGRARRAERWSRSSNTGPPVPAYEVDDLFEPFRRLNADRIDSARGAGLGLSIVRAVVRAHGGHGPRGAAGGRRPGGDGAPAPGLTAGRGCPAHA